MNNKIFFCIYIAVIFFCGSLSAQNLYDGSALPTVTGSGPGAESRPANYINFGGNVFPTEFNYTRKYTPLLPMTSIPGFDATKNTAVHVSTTYKDGFGQALMTIQRNGSSRDIIQPYDLRTRPVILQYLPYPDSSHRRFRMKPFEHQASYYQNKFPNEKETAYSKTKLDTTVDGIKATYSYLPGLQNVGLENGSVTTVHTNSAMELPLIFNNGSTICTTGGFWPAYSLKISKVVTAHGQETITYSDKNQRLICKMMMDNSSVDQLNGFATTYYIYDDLGKLTDIVTPKAYNELMNNGCVLNYRDLCYSFTYDEYGNVIEKYTPGREAPDEIVYDVNYKAVLSRSANMGDRNQWAFTIYDKQGRTVIAGMYTGGMETSYWRNVVLGKISPISRGVPAGETLEYWLKNCFSGTSYPTNLDSCIIYTYNYYDDYTNVPPGTPTTFDNSYTNDYLTGTGMVTPQPYYAVRGKLVASKVRILDNGIANNFSNAPWITSVYFYDEKSRIIQTHTKNPWYSGDWDVSSIQYNFSGKAVLDISTIHMWPGSNKPVTKIMNKSTFGIMTGRLETVQQKIDTGAWQPISGYLYDEMGAVKVKWLGNVEEQVYSYDIRGKSTGVNADSLLITSVVSNTKSFFSRLSYDHEYNVPRLDGALSGFMWRIRGHDPMSYGYEYDDMGRLTNAEFRAYNGVGTPTWNNSTIDFTVSGITYDVNGNMQYMHQRGYDNAMNPADIDMLTYTYDDANRLLSVEDAGTQSAPFIHDFEDVTVPEQDDYTYDANGNLQSDLNKDITGIAYNYLDLPDSVVAGTGTVKNIYTASGSLLQKIITENSVSDTLRYWGGFVFKNDTLDYLLHSEGRARYDLNEDKFTYDFFVKDHIGNVRTIVEGSSSYDEIEYHAGWEIISANYEERFFDQIGPVRATPPIGNPPMTGSHSGRLNGGVPTERIGASILVHVMAGDELNLEAYGYYEQEEPDGYTMYTMEEEMFNSLSDVMTNGVAAGGETGEYQTIITNLMTNTNYAAYDAIKQASTNNAFPRAYLNYLVFDEMFNLKPEYSQVIQITGGANAWQHMALPTRVVMPVTGYVMAYLSNESPFDVWVDNESLIHYESNLLEENHYYPHGLVIDAGSQSIQPKNDYLHQGKKLQRELGMELYDFHARQYDPQIGRFWGIDPADQFPSGYTGMGNDPANMIDPSGMWSDDYGMATNPAFARGITGQTLNQEQAMRYLMEDWTKTMMATRPEKVEMATVPLSDGNEGAAAGYSFADEKELESNRAVNAITAALASDFLNVDAVANTSTNQDEIGKTGALHVPSIGLFIETDLKNGIGDLYEKFLSGEIDSRDLKIGAMKAQGIEVTWAKSSSHDDLMAKVEGSKHSGLLASAGDGDGKKSESEKIGTTVTLWGAGISAAQQVTENIMKRETNAILLKRVETTHVRLGIAGYGLVVVGVANDFAQYKRGDITGQRLTYRWTGAGASLVAGWIWGGWVGAGVGLGFYAAEATYDNLPRHYNQFRKDVANWHYQLNSGNWVPGR